MRARPGITLLEMLVALSLTATAFTMALVALQGVYRTDHRLREELRNESDWGRFAGQFRADGHRAQSVRPGEETATTLVFSWAADEQAEYRLRGQRVERVERRQGKVRHQETYTLPKRLQARWHIAPSAEHPLAALVLEPEAGGAAGPFAPRPVRVDCAVGLFHLSSQSPNP